MKFNRPVSTRLLLCLLASQSFTIFNISASAQSAPNPSASRPANICDQVHETTLSGAAQPHTAIAKTSQIEVLGGAQ